MENYSSPFRGVGGLGSVSAYKATGNIAVDMVAACINHYERFGKKVAAVRLNRVYWTKFQHYVLAQIPGYDFGDGYVDFDGVQVTEGSTLQVKPMYWELAKEEPKSYRMK